MKFYLPVRLLTGRGVVAEQAPALAALGRRCLIVTSGSAARRCGALDDVTAALDAGGVAWEVYDAVRPNPTLDSCLEGGRLARAFGADFIIGIGGGSPLDASKVVAVCAANPALEAEGLFAGTWREAPLPIALVGTTAGTGSEVTPISVITGRDGHKRPVNAEALYAALSLGDPRYTESMPLSVTATTGVDALAHCLESYFNKNATPVSRALSLQGIAVLTPPLQSVAAGRMPTAQEREALYDGSILGGMAISICGTVMPHNMGYYLTEELGLPHGFACAAFLPALLRHAAADVPEYARTLEARCGHSLPELEPLCRSLVPALDLHLTDADIEALLPRWENAPAVLRTIGDVTPDLVRRALADLASFAGK